MIILFRTLNIVRYKKVTSEGMAGEYMSKPSKENLKYKELISNYVGTDNVLNNTHSISPIINEYIQGIEREVPNEITYIIAYNFSEK